jgi:hypothetical protein
MTTLSSLARTVRRSYQEQVYAWERLFRAGLPDPAQAREAASVRRRARELSVR